MTYYVYSLRDAHGCLLYLGMTDGDPQTRIAAHASLQDWFKDVADVTIDEHPNRRAAVAAEREILIEERPLYNLASPFERGDTVFTPLYSTREYAERLATAAAEGVELPTPETAGQALVLADYVRPLFSGQVSAALAKLAECYRSYAQITWRWDPTTGEFK